MASFTLIFVFSKQYRKFEANRVQTLTVGVEGKDADRYTTTTSALHTIKLIAVSREKWSWPQIEPQSSFAATRLKFEFKFEKASNVSI